MECEKGRGQALRGTMSGYDRNFELNRAPKLDHTQVNVEIRALTPYLRTFYTVLSIGLKLRRYKAPSAIHRLQQDLPFQLENIGEGREKGTSFPFMHCSACAC